MPSNFRDWLKNIPISDPLRRRQAGMFQVILLIMFGAAVSGLLLSIVARAGSTIPLLGLFAYGLQILFTGTAFILLRTGRFTLSVIVTTTCLMLILWFTLIATGRPDNALVLLAFSVPIVLVGLLLDRRGLLLFTALSLILVLIAVLLPLLAPSMVGFIKSPPPSAASTMTTFTLIIVVLGLLLDRFGSSLRGALISARVREHELEQLRASLETTVAERTISLQQALQAGELRESHLAQALVDLRTSQDTIRELSAPVIPVLKGVLVAPLIGAVDSRRAAELTENVLRMVERERASHVIFDITGVPLVDTQVAQVLLQATTTVRLLGAEALLVGIRPEVAQTMVALNIDMGGIKTYSSLREAIAALQDVRPKAVALAN